MNWILFVLIAHVLNAVNFVFDKFLLSKAVKDSFVYTFAIGVLGLAVLVLIPFGFEYPGSFLLTINLITGVFFVIALTLFFHTLKLNEASRIVPIIGSAIPVSTFFFSFLLLNEHLTQLQLLSLVLLVLGTYFISTDLKKSKARYTIRGLGLALVSAICFSISFVLNKYVFETQPFFSGFIWIRIGSFLAVIVMLLHSGNAQSVKRSWQTTNGKFKLMFVGNQVVGALAFLLLSYSISLASVTLVNALQGVQYVILLLAAIVLSRFYPKILSERLSTEVVVQKTLAIIFIGIGLFILSYFKA